MNTLIPTTASIHTMRQAKGKLVCTAKHCTFACSEWKDAMPHIAANQWNGYGKLPPELQLTPEQEAAPTAKARELAQRITKMANEQEAA